MRKLRIKKIKKREKMRRKELKRKKVKKIEMMNKRKNIKKRQMMKRKLSRRKKKNRKKYDHICVQPEQVKPDPNHPFLQVQLYVPTRLLHVACLSHLSKLNRHSSTSKIRNDVIYQNYSENILAT